jgi:hypothetical protein
MDVESVPQEGNRTLGVHRKAVYARDAEGRIVIVPSLGSEVDETVTLQAVDRLHALAAEAKERALAGKTSPLEYWMYERRTDVLLLSQLTGYWQWRIRRHFDPRRFRRLSESQLSRYASALGITTAQLRSLP